MVFGPYIQVVYIVANLAYIGALIALGWELGSHPQTAGASMLSKLINTLVGIAVIMLIILSAFLGLAFPLILFGIEGYLLWVVFVVFPCGALAFVTIGHRLGERHTMFDSNG